MKLILTYPTYLERILIQLMIQNKNLKLCKQIYYVICITECKF